MNRTACQLFTPVELQVVTVVAVLIVAVIVPAIAQGRSVRIALVSDPHTTRATSGDAASYRGRFERVIAEVNAAHPDLVLLAGDLTQGGKPEELDDFLALARRFIAPARYVYGNHDVGGKHMPGEGGGITAEQLDRVEARLGPSFWKLETPDVRVLGGNSSLLGSGLEREREQWAFLERELGRPSRQPTLLLMHYPLFTESPSEPGGVYWNVEPEPRQRLLGLLRRGRARGVLSGHLHHPLTLGSGGLFCYSAPSVAFGLPGGRQPEGWTLITIAPDGTIAARTHYLAEEPTGAAVK